jgi:hypothetical protein
MKEDAGRACACACVRVSPDETTGKAGNSADARAFLKAQARQRRRPSSPSSGTKRGRSERGETRVTATTRRRGFIKGTPESPPSGISKPLKRSPILSPPGRIAGARWSRILCRCREIV